MINEGRIKVKFLQDKSILELSHKFANLFFIDIFLNDNKITVMFDTGASVTVLNESAIKMLKAEITESTIKAGGSAGKVGDYKTAIVKKIDIGNNVIEEHEVVIVPDKALQFGQDDEGNLFPAKGVLGWDIISLFKWTIDDNKKITTIEQSQPRRCQCNRAFHLLHTRCFNLL